MNRGNLFDELNQRAFRGRLPKYKVIRRAALSDGCLGICSNHEKIILIKSTTPEEERLTLIHEMCHIRRRATGHQHGPMFRRKMARVARALGEPSLVKELERYDGTEAKRHIANQRAAGISVTEIPFKVAVSSDLESLALSANGWCSPWSGVRS